MIEGFLSFLQSPEFLTFAATYAGTKLLDAAGSKIKQLKSQSKQKTPEWQFIRCLELAFFTTETELGWEQKTEAIYESFEESLFSHQGFFTLESLKGIFENAIGHSVTEEQLEIWVRNFKRELAMGDYSELLKFLDVDHYFQSQSRPNQFETKYILTPNSSVCENKNIIGRDPFINDLLNMLERKNSRIQITGIGGLGKTETLNKLFARLASNRESSFFDHIAFIRFSGDILSDIQSQLKYPPEYLGLQGVEAAKRYLQDTCQEKKVLLCLDDIRKEQPLLDDHDPNIEFLRSLGASILLAARASFPGFDAHDLEFLSIDECIQVFERQYGQSITDDKDRKILKGIIENRAGNHTMVVNRLGSMAKVNIWSIPILTAKLEEKNFNFAKSLRDDELLQQEINKLYQINDTLSDPEKNLLEAFSIFPAVPLSADLCVEWLHEDAGVDEDNCARLLNRLADQTWLEKRCGCESCDVSFLMHQLVRTAVQEQVKSQYVAHQKLVEISTDSLQDSINRFNFKKSSLLIPFMESIFKHLYQESISFSRFSSEIASYYFETTVYDTSLAWYMKELTINEKVFGTNHQDTAATYNNIAGIYKCRGEYNLALEWYMKARTILEQILGEDCLDTSITYSNIAGVFKDLEEYALALEWYRKAVICMEKTLEGEHPYIATVYCGIGIVFEKHYMYDQALSWYKKALSIQEKLLGKNHPNTATTYSNIAGIYECQEEYNLALEWYKKALVINQRIYGKNHVATAFVSSNIARMYNNLGNYDLAIYWYNEAIPVCKELLGEEHPDLALIYNDVARIFINQRDYNQALKWLKKDLFISEKVLGKDNPDTALTYSHIASVFHGLGHNKLALEWYESALDIFERKLGPNHPNTIGVYDAINYIKNEH